MVTFTTNKALGLPTVGGDTGVWGQPLNNNSSVLDASLGGAVSISLSTVSGALTLLASNYNNTFLTFTGTLTQNTVVTLPAVGSFYTVNEITGAAGTHFTVTLQTTAAGSQAIGIPPYQPTVIFTDGANVKFSNLPHIGAYWDHAGSSVPAWVSACTVPPWLLCDGSQFSAATYPYLSFIFGSTTLPDLRGRIRAYLNGGTGRLTSSGGVDGNTIFAAGGSQTTTLSSLHLPQLIDPGHFHQLQAGVAAANFAGATVINSVSGTLNSSVAFTGITYGSSGQIGTPVVQPTLIGGITMIRAG